MNNKNRDLLIVLGLVLLSLMPILGGVLRILKIAAGDSTLENARFLASPVPIILHIISATLYSLLGAFQFSSHLRSKWPHWHRQFGKGLILLAVVVAVTGIWMTWDYPVANQDSGAVFLTRLVVGFLMLTFLTLGIEAIRLRKFSDHGNWMIRTYALAMGAGTQVFTHLPSMIFPSLAGETNRTIAMIFGWVINLAIAEWIIFNTEKIKKSKIKMCPLRNKTTRKEIYEIA